MIFKMLVLKNDHTFSASPIWGQKINFSKVWHVGTLNLKLRMLVTTQKSVLNFELPTLRKRPKCVQIWQFGLISHFWSHFGYFLRLGCSKLKTDFCVVTSIPSFKFRVPTCHTFEKFIFWPHIGLAEKVRA